MPKLNEQQILELEDDLVDINDMIDMVGLDDLPTLKDLCNKKQRVLQKLGRLTEKKTTQGKRVDWEF